MQPCPESSPSAPSPFLGGEINGMMLIGLINSLRNIQIISVGLAAQMAQGIDSANWYPMASFFKVLDEINRHDIDCAPILFQAGAAVPEDWHRHGGFAGISGAADFLRMQRGSGGYAMVNAAISKSSAAWI